MQTIHPFCEEAVDPLADCLRCGVVWPPVATDMPPSTTARTHLLSTFRRQAGILVGVQSVLSESLRLAKSASPVRTE
jgi:hypothetical protein